MIYNSLQVENRLLPPNDKIEQATPFQTIGTDFVDPIYYQAKSKKQAKALILIFSCSLSKAIHLELIANSTTLKFNKSLRG